MIESILNRNFKFLTGRFSNKELINYFGRFPIKLLLTMFLLPGKEDRILILH